MPCTAPVRGKADTKYPWCDPIQNDPCGAKKLTSVGGVDVSAQNLCLFHWQQQNGQKALIAPIVVEP